MTATAGSPLAFWHVGITVANLETSLGFYRDALGLEVTARTTTSSAATEVWAAPGASADIVFLRVPGGPEMLELLEVHGVDQDQVVSRPTDIAHGHLCLEVQGLDDLHARLTQHGYRSRSSRPVPIPSGPLCGGRTIYVLDPDGFSVELVERP